MRIALILLAFGVTAFADDVFVPGSEWETVSQGHRVVEGIAADGAGNIYLTDVPESELFKIDSSGSQTLLDEATKKANGLAIGPSGRLFGASMAEPLILSWNLTGGGHQTIKLPTQANDLAISAEGSVYYTWPAANAVYHFKLSDPKPAEAADVAKPNGITLSYDEKEVWVGEFHGESVRVFPILPSGDLGPSSGVFVAKVPKNGKGLLDGMTPLSDGRLLAATALGLQILARNEKAIVLPNPTSNRANYVRIITDTDGQRWIYVAHEKSVLRRKTLLRGPDGK